MLVIDTQMGIGYSSQLWVLEVDAYRAPSPAPVSCRLSTCRTA